MFRHSVHKGQNLKGGGDSIYMSILTIQKYPCHFHISYNIYISAFPLHINDCSHSKIYRSHAECCGWHRHPSRMLSCQDWRHSNHTTEVCHMEAYPSRGVRHWLHVRTTPSTSGFKIVPSVCKHHYMLDEQLPQNLCTHFYLYKVTGYTKATKKNSTFIRCSGLVLLVGFIFTIWHGFTAKSLTLLRSVFVDEHTIQMLNVKVSV